MGALHQITVFTDHRNLEYFSAAKVLNRRQARWLQFLVDFDYAIQYRPGQLGGKPNLLSRRINYELKEGDEHMEQQCKSLIDPSKFVNFTATQHNPVNHTNLVANSGTKRNNQKMIMLKKDSKKMFKHPVDYDVSSNAAPK